MNLGALLFFRVGESRGAGEVKRDGLRNGGQSGRRLFVQLNIPYLFNKPWRICDSYFGELCQLFWGSVTVILENCDRYFGEL